MQDSTKDKILEASWDEFVDRGYSGARMQRIADNASVNKAMIYYYFSSKDTLFESMIQSVFERFFSSMFSNIDYEDMSFEEMVRKFVNNHINFLQKNPQIPKVVVRELHSNNPITSRVLRDFFVKVISQLIEQVRLIFDRAVERGEIRNVDPMQTMWSIAGMNLFYFLLNPVLVLLLQAMELEEEAVLEQRKEAIIDLLLYGLVPRENIKETT